MWFRVRVVKYRTKIHFLEIDHEHEMDNCRGDCNDASSHLGLCSENRDWSQGLNGFGFSDTEGEHAECKRPGDWRSRQVSQWFRECSEDSNRNDRKRHRDWTERRDVHGKGHDDKQRELNDGEWDGDRTTRDF